MRLLLDTHVLLWAVGEPKRLTDEARRALADTSNDLSASAASVWEIGIKVSLGKLKLPGPVDPWLFEAAQDLDVGWISVEPTDAAAAAGLPMHHRDPFDRMLVAQARRGFTLLTHDRSFAAYGVPVVWA